MLRRLFLGLVGIGMLVLFAIAGYYLMNPSLLNGGVRRFGPLMLGQENPGGWGSYTFAPEMVIPHSKFYITVAQKDLSCTFSYCTRYGKLVKDAGGWLQGEDTDQPTIRDIFGLDDNPGAASVVVVAGSNDKIVGIYPNKDIGDLLTIMKVHWKLIYPE